MGCLISKEQRVPKRDFYRQREYIVTPLPASTFNQPQRCQNCSSPRPIVNPPIQQTQYVKPPIQQTQYVKPPIQQTSLKHPQYPKDDYLLVCRLHKQLEQLLYTTFGEKKAKNDSTSIGK